MSVPLRSQRQPFHSLCLQHRLLPGLCSSVPTSVRVNFVPTWNLMPARHFHFRKSPSSHSASFLKPASLPTFVEMPSFFKGSCARAPLVLGASPHISAVPRACSFPFKTSPGSILLCCHFPRLLSQVLLGCHGLPVGFSVGGLLFLVIRGGCLLLPNLQWLFPKSMPLGAHAHLYHLKSTDFRNTLSVLGMCKLRCCPHCTECLSLYPPASDLTHWALITSHLFWLDQPTPRSPCCTKSLLHLQQAPHRADLIEPALGKTCTSTTGITYWLA